VISAGVDVQKIWIISIAPWAGWFSTASSFIYYPAIPFMVTQMGVSVEQINLTVTSYMIASGLFPTIVGTLADRYGRRITLVVTISVYVVTNVALTLRRSFPALLVLRMLQSAAISGGILYNLWHSGRSNLRRGARRIFRGCLHILEYSSERCTHGQRTPSAQMDMAVNLLILSHSFVRCPDSHDRGAAETGRNLVSVGRRAIFLVGTPLFSILSPPRQEQLELSSVADSSDTGKKFNPLSAVEVLKERGTLISSICFGVYYMDHSCLQASLSTVFVQTYQVTGLVAGLIYIPFGVGCAIASFVAVAKLDEDQADEIAGKIVDQDYRVIANKTSSNRNLGEKDAKFPFEQARLRSYKCAVIVCSPLTIGYGWSLQATNVTNITPTPIGHSGETG
ncbi:uncharacterized protein PG986_012718, partial [Apiospora aurea]